jgi:hypothetical protein
MGARERCSVEHWNTVPDIICLGKALGGVMPLRPSSRRRRSGAFWRPTPSSTRPPSAATARRAADRGHQRDAQEGLVGQASRKGKYLLGRRSPCSSPTIGHPEGAGQGLLLGLKFANKEIGYRVAGLFNRGVWSPGTPIRKCGSSRSTHPDRAGPGAGRHLRRSDVHWTLRRTTKSKAPRARRTARRRGRHARWCSGTFWVRAGRLGDAGGPPSVSRPRRSTVDVDEAATARLSRARRRLNCVTYYFNVPVMRAACGPRSVRGPRRPSTRASVRYEEFAGRRHVLGVGSTPASPTSSGNGCAATSGRHHVRVGCIDRSRAGRFPYPMPSTR